LRLRVGHLSPVPVVAQAKNIGMLLLALFGPHRFVECPLRAISGRSRMRVYSILALLPVETDGRLRNRIKSNEENFERIVIEDSLSRLD
jgi:hypothetical protein